MAVLGTKDKVLEQLDKSGYLRYVTLTEKAEAGWHGVIQLSALPLLAGDERFANGVFYGMHTDVGDHLTDFRSFNGAFGKGSLQLVIDKETGAIWADVDAANPYQDLVHFVWHGFGEVIPGWCRSIFGRRQRSS